MLRHYYKVFKMINAIDLAYDMVIIRYLQNIIEFWKHYWYVVERMKIVTKINFPGRDCACPLLIIGQNITLFYITVVVVFYAEICKAQICDSVNHTSGTKFESNLNTVMNSLVNHTYQTGFNTSAHGQSPDRIYGLLQCRGDATVDECYKCSQDATTIIPQKCENAVGGRTWAFICFIRYENYSFIGKLDTNGMYISGKSNVSNPHAFNTAVKKLLANLSAKVVSGGYGPGYGYRYASGTIKDSWFRTIYGLVQCFSDISTDDCNTCLKRIINHTLASYAGISGGQGLVGSCIAIYDINPFYNSGTHAEAPTILPAITPPPSEAPTILPAITPPPSETPTKPEITPSSNNSTQINQSKKSSNKRAIILGVVGGSLFLLSVCMLTTGRRLKTAIHRRGYEGHRQVEEDTLISEGRQTVFTMKTLISATENFHDDNKLGEGGFGPVYKGLTEDGKEIAVKKLSLNSMQGKKEFRNEVQLVAKIQHRNLVNLLGCCAEGSERLLVYEYLQNKSLDKILFDPNKRKNLDWAKRYNIVLGIARGLLYLHQDSQLRIIHRDIKSSNILLDEKLNPKIADFGLARLFPEDETHVSTKVAGTLGYMAPEYAQQGLLSVKADVYSFGVLLLELITGRKNADFKLPPEMQILLGWAWKSYKRGNIEQMIDPTIIETCDDKEQALRFIQVGLLCTQADSSLRPTMSTVNLMLSTHYVELPDPTRPGFLSSSVTQNTTSTSSGSGLPHVGSATTSSSVSSASFHTRATASISDLVPR